MPSAMPWVKIYTEILDDPKLGELPAETKWCYVQLIVLAGDYDADGYIVTRDSLVTHANIAWRLRVTVETLTRDINLLCECGLVEIDHGAIFIPKFAERQGRKQSEKREQWRERQAKSREKHDSDVTRDSRVTHAPRGEERRGEKRKRKREKKKRVQKRRKRLPLLALPIYFLMQLQKSLPQTQNLWALASANAHPNSQRSVQRLNRSNK